MPDNPNPYLRLEQLSRAARLLEPDRCQEHWYALAGQYCADKTVLDVGSGTGYGLPLLFKLGARSTLGTDPLPAGPGVTDLDPATLPDGCADVVTAMDVIEHVDDDQRLLKTMLRLAREAVFFSTPIWDGRVWGRYHAREYSAEELAVMLAPYHYRAWTCGDGLGESVPVRVWPLAHLGEAWRSVGVLIDKTRAPQNALALLVTAIRSGAPPEDLQARLDAAVQENTLGHPDPRHGADPPDGGDSSG